MSGAIGDCRSTIANPEAAIWQSAIEIMPEWEDEIRWQLAGLRLEPAREAEIVEELAQHLDDRYRELLGAGASPDLASRAVLAELSESQLLAQEMRRAEERIYREPIELGARRKNMISDLQQDLRYGLRTLRRNPGFTFVAASVLALGIGANSAIFSVVSAVLLRPLPYHNPDRLVMIWESEKSGAPTLSSPASFLDWREQSRSFTHLAAVRSWDGNLAGVDAPERIQGALATADLFDVLGVQPFLGRTFSSNEDQEGRPRVVVLGYGLWQRRFGGDPGVIGRIVKINSIDRSVIGVMPSDFKLPLLGVGNVTVQSEMWTPWVMDANYRTRRDLGQLRVVARLAPEATPKEAQAELSLITARQQTESSPSFGVQVVPLHRNLVSEARPALLVLLGAVACVLLIACANVANLLLARAAARTKEVAIRAALGADRGRVFRQLLTESLLFSMIGGAMGLVFALWVTRMLVALSPENLPRADEIGIDWRVLGFTVVVSLVTGIAFGLAPAWQMSKTDVCEALKEGGQSSTQTFGWRGVRSMLVVAELALAVVLLVGAGLMIKSLWRLSRVDAGFSAENVLTMRVSLPGVRYGEDVERSAFFDQVLQHVESLPGVEAAGVASAIPLTGWQNTAPFLIEGRQEMTEAEESHVASPDYFRAMGIDLVAGRGFNDMDRAQSAKVAIVSQGLARRYWTDEDPIGKRIRLGGDPQEPWRTIVGIVGDIKQTGLDGEATREYYIPYKQDTWGMTYDLTVVMRTASEPLSLVGAAQEQVRAIDGELPVHHIHTLAQLRAQSSAPRRFLMLLLTSFGGVALLLAAVGIYGVISYGVSRRTHEIGIRLALGAQVTDVLKLVFRQGLTLILIGIGTGLAGAWALTRVMSSLLFDVTATDPATFVAISVLLAAVATLACYVPARRATKVDPMVALRYE
ncbi:MAG: ABC transporter permease [Blastocatellia bacterium]